MAGEAGDLDDGVVAQLMLLFKDKLSSLSTEYRVSSDRIYNADQTGLFYRQLPNRMFVDEDKVKSTRGVKQMKDKDRVTLMMCIAANGEKLPLAMVGKSKLPACFRMIDKVPMDYTHQQNAWFDRAVTRWWINTTFLPYHRRKHGEEKAILILDNCPAHDALEAGVLLYGTLIVLFLPPNLTSRHQPCDMGIIQGLKTGYKMTN